MDTSPPIARNILLTGLPGCGKTTVISRIVDRLAQLRLAGFYTREIRERGDRKGFEAVGLHGSSVVLGHVDFSGRQRVGRYGVDVAGFEKLIESELSGITADADAFVIDEIGKMECLSRCLHRTDKPRLGQQCARVGNDRSQGWRLHRRCEEAG